MHGWQHFLKVTLTITFWLQADLLQLLLFCTIYEYHYAKALTFAVIDKQL